MLDFYRAYFLPSSKTRSKASVHLIAQSSAADIVAKTDPREQTAKLISTVSQLLGQLGVEVDTAALEKRLGAVDISGGDTARITSAVGGYLKDTAGMATEQVEQVMQQGRVVIAQVLPSLGIVSKDESAEAARDGGEVGQSLSKTIVVEDVKAFKASMPLSAGAAPVKDLSEFEEVEPKL